MLKKLLLLVLFLFVFALNTRETSAQGNGIRNFLGSIDFINPQHVVCDSGCATPAGTNDQTPFIVAETNVALIGAAFAEALADMSSPTYGAVRMTAKRSLHVVLFGSDGLEYGTSALHPFYITASNFQLTPNGDIPFITTIQGGTDGQIVGNSGTSLNVICTSGCGTAATFEVGDGTAITQLPQIGTFNHYYNGTSWDRVRGDTTNGAWVNVKATTTTPVTGTFWQSTQPVSGTFWPTLFNSYASVRLTDGGGFYNALKASDTLTKVGSIDNINNSVAVTGTFFNTAVGIPASVRLSDSVAFYKALTASDTLTKVTTVDTITNPVSVTGTFFNTAAASPSSERLSDGTNFYNALKSTDTLTKVTTVDTITNPVAVTGTFWPTAAATPSSNRLSDGSAFYNALKATDTLTGITTLTSITNPVAVTGTFWATQGQALMSASQSVTIASDQSAIAVAPLRTLPLPQCNPVRRVNCQPKGY